ncbi:hypothetical protein Tcan_00815, partial [Toxocara canis]
MILMDQLIIIVRGLNEKDGSNLIRDAMLHTTFYALFNVNVIYGNVRFLYKLERERKNKVVNRNTKRCTWLWNHLSTPAAASDAQLGFLWHFFGICTVPPTKCS